MRPGQRLPIGAPVGALIVAALFVFTRTPLGAQANAQANVADSLFEHARKAETPAAARRDYLRIIVDYPFSSRAEEALLRAGQLEYESGDKTSARRHLERLAIEYTDGATRARGAFWLARVLLDAGEPRAACDQLTEAKVRAKSSEVEFLGQVNYYAQSCARVLAAAAADIADSSARADSVVRADAVEKSTAAKKGAVKRGPSKETFSGPAWSAQVAAYTAEADAKALAKKLSARGFEARVTPAKPYRVRIGRFRTRADAAEQVRKLRDAKMTAIVVEAEHP
jgi:cell division septation protein DedD